ncbi:hypothetical protein ABZY44_12155 [Streptomyces sp. NPDC006544]|uniref:hypothetical protein n=1 Tax=Streptomyces sp. NPDC006544 TaxID=3154583 RepID=UPI0033A4D642
MTLHIVGALCVAIAIVGGGLKINEVVEVPRLSRRRMIALVFAGLFFIGVGVMVDQTTSPTAATAAPGSPTHTL